MLEAARALVKTQFLDIGDEPNAIVEEFRRRFVDTELFFDPYASDKFARYLFQAHEAEVHGHTPDLARRLIEEAGLFIEAAHRCAERISPADLAGP